jgi:integrase
MGSIYRRTELLLDEQVGQPVCDPRTGKPKRIEIGPYWIKYYRHGRPFRESTGTLDKTVARRRLKQREGEVAEGRFRGLNVDRTRFDELAADLKADYLTNKKKTHRRVDELVAHLEGHFKGCRAMDITTERVQRYIAKRQEEGAANATINRELGALKRMYSLAMKHTPPKVAVMPHIPMLEEHNVRSGFFEHEDFLALRGALPDYAQVAVTLAYYSGMRMGEICSLQWSQINWTEGKLYLKAQDTKNETPRVLYLTGDLYRVLDTWRQRCQANWPACLWICHYNGERLQSLKKAWKTACTRVGLGQMVKDEEKGRKVWRGKIPHDFRRTAIRNMVRAGVPEKVAMAISGQKTRSVFDRYNIVNEADLKAAATRLSGYFLDQMGTISGTVAELREEKHQDVAV